MSSNTSHHPRRRKFMVCLMGQNLLRCAPDDLPGLYIVSGGTALLLKIHLKHGARPVRGEVHDVGNQLPTAI